MLCNLNLNSTHELEFSIKVQGSSAKTVEPRFVILTDTFGIVCFCQPEGDVVKVHVPKLAGIIPSGTYDVRFEIILDDQLFVPVKDTIKFKEPPVVKAELDKSTAEDQLQVTAVLKAKVTEEQVEVIVPIEIPPAPVPTINVEQLREQIVVEQPPIVKKFKW